MRSDNVTKGSERAPNRSLFYALGYTPEELDRPLIGVVSAYSEIVPGHMNLDKIADAVKAGVQMAGGTPILIPAIGVCDGIAMGHVGMKYSLASRELICDSVETMLMAHQLDGLVLVPNCDKIVPGMVMAAVRMDVPAVVCSGGPMLAGTYGGEEVSLSKMFEAVGAYKAGMITDEQLEDCTCNCCPSCGSWNTMNEDVVAEAPKAGLTGGKTAAPARQEGVTSLTAKRLSEISTTEEKSRILTGISELDRVLGGGIVLGGVVLLSGEPGVGKSTMLLQLCGAISNQHTVLYITGEESVRQVKLRAARLKVPQDNIYLAAENDVDEICGLIEKEKPELVVIDSIQTMRCMDISSSSGTVSQVKESAARLLAVAKKQEIPMFIVGHVNKDGAIAGPKVMEHIVDTVLYFEGDKMLPYRLSLIHI